MSNGDFTFETRTQFSFIADDRTLNYILRGIAGQEINITGYLQTKYRHNEGNCTDCNLVRLVAGSTDSEARKDLRGVREVLDYLSVDFQEKEVIQVVAIIPETPGVINAIFGALWCKVIVFAIYIGEETRLFIDTSDNRKAICILSQNPVEQCLGNSIINGME